MMQILGLGFSDLSNLPQSSFFKTAVNQKVVSQAAFGFKLASSGSELFLGGTNNELFSGDIEFHKVNPSTGFWQVPGASIKVDGQTIVDSFETILDSGAQ
jgi:cathepsin D